MQIAQNGSKFEELRGFKMFKYMHIMCSEALSGYSHCPWFFFFCD